MVKVPTEDYECLQLVNYLERLVKQRKVVKFTKIPNETFTKSWKIKRKNKILGVRKGFPDYVVVTKWDILFIEMKKTKGGVVRPEQSLWIDALNQAMGDDNAKVCKGFDEAKTYIESRLINY